MTTRGQDFWLRELTRSGLSNDSGVPDSLFSLSASPLFGAREAIADVGLLPSEGPPFDYGGSTISPGAPVAEPGLADCILGIAPSGWRFSPGERVAHDYVGRHQYDGSERVSVSRSSPLAIGTF